MIAVRNKYQNLQERSEAHTPYNDYETFTTAHIEAAECIPRAKCRVP